MFSKMVSIKVAIGAGVQSLPGGFFRIDLLPLSVLGSASKKRSVFLQEDISILSTGTVRRGDIVLLGF